ncbi:ABC transporter substrate-binding protein [Pseudonocardia oroxyli]|uniref:Carbohydrate ABC transporter substrate-binding protein, CUT1 family n=1 Tax=Pseudonocardia oroxyli TaxID=366584 RepID=A0A1G7EP61_PSEOR|nr:sugar ABC transporter substrate-binding protein [Pseudonocardia oroxyli]SDE65468.1 carbohydrate ABC transporter substrate-binding protein, CUT1 family [Pseudonocardia oroxyli]
MPRRALLLSLLLTVLLAACSAPGETPVTTVTLRLWDDQVAKAYGTSFAEFERQNPDIRVDLDVVPYADYFVSLPAQLERGQGDDIFWLNSAYLGTLADSGALLDIERVLPGRAERWVPAAVDQYTRDGGLWGVPALTDGRIVTYYNTALLAQAGVDPTALTWNPDPAKDTLLPALRRLTVDTAGRRADEPGFDPTSVATYGFNAGRDLQAVYYEFIGSNGGRFQAADGTFAFAEPRSVEAFQYLVDLINVQHVAPPADDTNDNADYARDAFLAGRLAIFQSGTYNLRNVADGATFDWAIAPMVAGPAGRVSVVNSVVAAGNAKTPHPEAVARVLDWIGSEPGADPVGGRGAALPAVTGSQQKFFDYWRERGVETGYFGALGGTATIDPPTGPRFGTGSRVFSPILGEIFAGRLPVAEGLQQAQDSANAAIRAG